MSSYSCWFRFKRKIVQGLGNVLVDDFVHRALPINLGIQVDEVNAQGGGDKQQVVFGNADRTTFDLGNGAAGGVVPAGKLQLDGKLLLRPAVALAQFVDLSSDQIQLLHGNRVSISGDFICVVTVWNKLQPLFLPPIRRAGSDENITTFVRVLTAVFTMSFVAKPEINLVYDVHEMLIRRCYHRAIFSQTACG
jgi:hypothetical protein